MQQESRTRTRIRSVVGAASAVMTILLLAPPAPAVTTPAAPGKPLQILGEYGQPGMTVPRGPERVRLTFRGRKGDTVGFVTQYLNGGDDDCDKVSLRRNRSGVVARWSDDLWRLPAPGQYTFDYHRCRPRDRGYVQLVKLRLHPLPLDGRLVRLGHSRNRAYIDAGTVVVPRDGRVQVRPTHSDGQSAWSEMHRKGRPNVTLEYYERDVFPQAVYLEGGAPASNEFFGLPLLGQPAPLKGGERVILVPAHRRLPVRATRTRTTSATLDGGTTSVSATKPFQEVGLQFWSDGGEWVTPNIDGSLRSRSMQSLALVGPDGRALVGFDQARHGDRRANLWHLPTAGHYRLMVRTDPEHDSGTIAMSTVRELGAELPADGRPLAVTAQKPGEWVLATGQLGDEPYELTAEAPDATDWRVLANELPFQQCLGAFCDQRSSAHLTPTSPSSYGPLHTPGQWVFVVGFGPGQTGTVSLRLTPTRNLPPA